MAVRPLNTLPIGAGGLGIEMGLHLCGVETRPVCYVEREAFAAANLVAKMEEGVLAPAPVWSDARTFDPDPWRGLVDCITSGYPCQPFSSAGKRKGKGDPRHLWPCIAYLIGELEPGLCFFENSPRHRKHGFDEVWRDLRAMGYYVEAGTFTAEEVGAYHGRERLFILAAHPDRYPLRQFPERGQGSAQEAFKGDAEPRYDGAARTHPDANVDGLEGIEASRVHAQWERWDHPDGFRFGDYRLRREPWASGPVPKPSIQRVVDGVAPELDMCVRPLRNHRLYVVGNGVVPLAAARAFETLGARFDDDYART